MNHKRTAGVLLHLSSLNGPFSVGVMGKEAFAFVDKLQRTGFSLWQMLPLCPVDHTGSPYCSVSAFAGNVAFIDPRLLKADGLVTDEEVRENEYHGSEFAADWNFAVQKRLSLLKKAFLRIDDDTRQLISIFAGQNDWARPFALFSALKDYHNQKPWWEWENRFAHYETALAHADEFEEETQFYIFTQYVFFTQFRSLKEYANSRGISIMGDMPIYVSRDSADVWSNTELFLLDKVTLAPSKVAGVPPDYFSEDGQLWGNPLYDWEKMEDDGYRWWIKRIGAALKLFDRVRIDHFRAFASYWAVDAESETAKNGEWLKGPGMKLFEKIRSALPQADIVAEDLGTFGEDVVKLLEDTNFPGMRVIQFGFDVNSDSTHLPHNYDKNCVAYVGTHDNNTILGWLWEASEQERAFALRYCCFGGNNWGEGGFYSGSCRAVIEAVWRSSAQTAVVAVQDMCGFGSDARMNRPGTSEDNWSFRITQGALDGIDENYFREINSVYRR